MDCPSTADRVALLAGELSWHHDEHYVVWNVAGTSEAPYEPSAFRDGMGVWDGASVARKHAELWEAAALRQIGFESAAPVCVVNVDGYYDGFGTMLARAHAEEAQRIHQAEQSALDLAVDDQADLSVNL